MSIMPLSEFSGEQNNSSDNRIMRWRERYYRQEAAISTLKAQRDELLAAAKTAYEVLIQERDHIPMTLRLVMPNGAIKRLRAAIANAERPAGC